MRIKPLLIFVLFIFLVHSIFAEPDYNPVDPYDPLNPDSYSSPEFYQNIPPDQWQWTMVDWSHVDLNNAELYDVAGFYENLPANKYGQIDYNLVDYQMVDQKKINPTKFFSDNYCTHCTIETKGQVPGNDFFFDKGMLMHSKGQQVNFNGQYSENSKVIITKDRIIMDCTDAVALGDTELNTDDDVSVRVGPERVDYDKVRNPDEDLDEPIELTVNGVAIEGGRVDIEDGGVYVTNDDDRISYDSENIHAVVGGVTVIPAEDSKVRLYSDGEKHDDQNYVSVDPITKNIEAEFWSDPCGEFDICGYESHSLVIKNIEKGNSPVSINFENNEPGKLSLESRNSEGLVPKLTIQGDGSVSNGDNNLYFDPDGTTKLLLFNDVSKSQPLAIYVEDLGGYSESKYLSNGLAISALEADYDPTLSECHACVENMDNNPVFIDQVKYLYALAGFDGKIHGDGARINNLMRILPNLETLPDSVKDSVGWLMVAKDTKQMKSICGGTAAACAFGNVILFSPSLISKDLVYHEAGHTLTNKIRDSENQKIFKEATRLALELDRKYYSGSGYQEIDLTEDDKGNHYINVPNPADLSWPDQMKLIQLNNQLTLSKGGTFIDQWQRAVGDEKFIGYDGFYKYRDEILKKYASPTNLMKTAFWEGKGFVHSYGTSKLYEDISTYLEEIDNSALWTAVGRKSSPLYDSRYERKLDLLHQNGFLKDNDYEKIKQNMDQPFNQKEHEEAVSFISKTYVGEIK